MKHKKAAMEMSVGTLVTIVLLMVVLVLGIVLIQSIFRGGTNAVNEIDAQIQDQINKMFAQEGTKFVVYPPSREIRIEQGDSGGVGFSIRNNGDLGAGLKTFTYNVATTQNLIQSGCGVTADQANNLIILGKTDSTKLLSGNKMDRAFLIKFNIPKITPLCTIRYKITVTVEGASAPYGETDFDLKIVS